MRLQEAGQVHHGHQPPVDGDELQHGHGAAHVVTVEAGQQRLQHGQDVGGRLGPAGPRPGHQPRHRAQALGGGGQQVRGGGGEGGAQPRHQRRHHGPGAHSRQHGRALPRSLHVARGQRELQQRPRHRLAEAGHLQVGEAGVVGRGGLPGGRVPVPLPVQPPAEGVDQLGEEVHEAVLVRGPGGGVEVRGHGAQQRVELGEAAAARAQAGHQPPHQGVGVQAGGPPRPRPLVLHRQLEAGHHPLEHHGDHLLVPADGARVVLG